MGLVPSGGYSGKFNYINKVLMLFVYREQTDDCKILHTRNGSQYIPPELPHLIVDGFCVETRNVYELLGCYMHD